MPRVLILGCGTAVGKTWLSVALLRALTKRGFATLGLKPIESGVRPSSNLVAGPPDGSDAGALASAGSFQTPYPHPLFALVNPVSPHLAARAQGVEIDLKRSAEWVGASEHYVTTGAASHSALWTVIETAGGVFSPLSRSAANYELAVALEPAIWVLVAPDELGVLHDVSATLQAMRARGRVPDHLVLSGAREPDASTGGNASELATLGIAAVSAVLRRNNEHDISKLADLLISGAASPAAPRG